MHISRRAIIAETIKDLFLDGFTAQQKNNLKRLAACIGESRLLDVLLDSLCMIRPGKAVKCNKVISSISGDARNEYVYIKITEGLGPASLQYLNTMLYNQNKFLAYQVERTTQIKNSMAATRNIVDMLLKLDLSKLTDNRSQLIRKALNNTAKRKLIDESGQFIKKCRPVFKIIVDAYGSKTGDFTSEMMAASKGNTAEFYVGKATIESDINYMNVTPVNMHDIKSQIDWSKDTTARRAIDNARKMEFTLDKDFNNALMAIIDMPIFDKIVAGKSTDHASTAAKLSSIRTTIKAGIAFWHAAGSGNVSFNYVADFRGRISQLGGLSAVGHKAGKAMLRSGVKYPLLRDGYENILIALAGSMGHDKETFKQRKEWAIKNCDMFTNIGGILLSNPEAAFNALLKAGADEIFSAASICLELYRIKNRTCDLRDYQSNLFIGYDATSSAVQLVGLIMGNRKLTEASNCRVGSDTEDRIYDAYMLIADSMDIAAPKLMGDEKIDRVLKMWLSFDKKVKRAIAKPCLMTRLYGSTFLTHKDSAEEIAIENGIIEAGNREVVKVFGLGIARLFNAAFDNEDGFNALRSYEKFVKEIATAYTEVGQHVTWHVYDTQTEDMQEVKAVYLEIEGDLYYYFTGDKKKRNQTYNLYLGNDCAGELDLNNKVVINKAKAKSAIAPNYIHSHDALVLHRLVNSMDCPIRLTHDCFAVPAGRLTEMHKNVVEIYADLFGDNQIPRIELLQKECFNNTGILVDLPTEYNAKGIPEEEILKAQYMVS